MTCSPPILIVPGGCLDKEVMEIACKSPLETKSYLFTVSNRLSPVEEIDYVIAQPAGNSGVSVHDIKIDGQTFKCKIKGGYLNKNVGIRFIIQTKLNNIIEFNCKLPVRSAGILYDDGSQSIILDPSSPAGTIIIGKVEQVLSDKPATVTNIGTPEAAILNFEIPQGDEGKAATIEIGEVKTGEPETKAAVVNTGTSSNAILDFILPTGKDGEVQTVVIGETKTLPAGYAATVEATTVDNLVTLTFGIPSGTTGETGQYILNIGKIETLRPDEQATASITSDGKGNHSLNLGIPQGKIGNNGKDGENGRNGIDGISTTISIGTVSTLDPGQKATAEINHDANGKDTLNLGLVKGDQGESYINDGSVDLNVKTLMTRSLSLSNLTAKDVDFIKNSDTAFQNGNYTPKDQSAYQGQFITQVGFNVLTSGTLTVYIIDAVGTTNGVKVYEVTLNVVKGQTWYDFNKYLPVSMYLAFGQAGKDTAHIGTGSGPEQFWYNSGQLNAWNLTWGVLNMGVKVKNTSNIYHSLKGKSFSIIGDSISTYANYNGKGMASQYPTSDVQNVDDTWWMQVAQKTGAKFVNVNSISASPVSAAPSGDNPFYSVLQLPERLTSIPSNVDICFIQMGVNDLIFNRTFGDFNLNKKPFYVNKDTYSDSGGTFNPGEFTDAVCNSIVQLQTNYPTTKFVWLIPMNVFTDDNIQYTKNNQTHLTYRDRIIEICNFYNIAYIDTTNIGINYLNWKNYLIEGIHPKKAGMALLANCVINNYK